LKKEKAIPPKADVIIPEGGYDYEVEEVDDIPEFSFSGFFEVFIDPDKQIGWGEAWALGYFIEPEEGKPASADISDLVVHYPKED